MSIKNKTALKEKSSAKVADFLEKNALHKKDFAQMIGVTLSYVYNLIDETIPFSTRATTLERIATVMDILPEEFEEYLIQEEPVPFNHNLQVIKDKMSEAKIKTVDFLKTIERKKRLNLVDMLRGAKAIPVDYFELQNILKPLKLQDKDIFEIWQNRIVEYLKQGGLDYVQNEKLLDKMFDCAKKYLI